jgi:ABC-2 type transport system permease protein
VSGIAFGLRAPLLGILISFGFIAVLAASLAAVSYTAGLLLKSEDALAPMINMVVVPLMLLSGIMLPMALAPNWLNRVSQATPFRYIINAMRDAFQGHYTTTVMAEGVGVAIGLTVICLWFGAQAFQRENA